jgi:hypothetical protein
LSGIFSGETGDSSNGDLVAGAKSRRGDVVLPSLRDSMSTNRFPFATPSNFFVIFFTRRYFTFFKSAESHEHGPVRSSPLEDVLRASHFQSFATFLSRQRNGFFSAYV